MKNTVYRKYLLTLLMAVLTFNYIDRIALSMVLQEVKVALHLSDTDLGFLNGLAFAFFYAIMGIPIAAWADRGNRVTIITATTALWSVMVALTGRVTTFAQLLLARVAVAIGEAGCIPAANSLIPDYFERSERPRAMGIYLLGGSLSLIVGYFAAGWLNQLVGWRLLFPIIALPGLLLAALAWLTLVDPRARGMGKRAEISEASSSRNSDVSHCRQSGAYSAFRVLWKNATYRELLIVFSVTSFFGYGALQWIPAFFIRSYGFETGPLGTLLALTYGVGGLVGTYAGGAIASRYAAKSEALQFRIMAAALCALSVIWISMFLVYNAASDFALLSIGICGGATINGPIFAAIQTLVPTNMRAMSIAIVCLFSNLIGTGLGPLAVGALSHLLHPDFDQQSLREALLVMCPGYIWAAWHLWRAARTVQHDLHAMAPSDGNSTLRAVH